MKLELFQGGRGARLLESLDARYFKFANDLPSPLRDVALMESTIVGQPIDEPFRGLHRRGRQQLLAAARRHWQGATVLCVTHDLSETLDFEWVVVVEAGRIVEQGPPRALLDSPDGHYRRLLFAEEQVREQLWGGARWRALHLADGRLSEGLWES